MHKNLGFIKIPEAQIKLKNKGALKTHDLQWVCIKKSYILSPIKVLLCKGVEFLALLLMLVSYC